MLLIEETIAIIAMVSFLFCMQHIRCLFRF